MEKLSKINETIWGDINRRSQGQQVRKEDDVNFMDKDMFFKYLKDIYKATMLDYDIRDYTFPHNEILMPISINGLYRPGSVSYVTLEFDESSDEKIVALDARSLHRLPEGCEDKLKTIYKIKYMKETSRRQAYITISPKDLSPVTNTFYIEVIDFLLDNVKDGYNKLIKKVK